MNFVKNLKPITICDIGASPINKTEFIEDLIICYVPSLLILGIVLWALN